MQTSVGRWKQAGLTRIARLVQSQDPNIHEQKHPSVIFTARLRLSKYIWLYGYLRFPIHFLGGTWRDGYLQEHLRIQPSASYESFNKPQRGVLRHFFSSYLNLCGEFETKGGANVKGTDHELRKKKT